MSSEGGQQSVFLSPHSELSGGAYQTQVRTLHSGGIRGANLSSIPAEPAAAKELGINYGCLLPTADSFSLNLRRAIGLFGCLQCALAALGRALKAAQAAGLQRLQRPCPPAQPWVRIPLPLP